MWLTIAIFTTNIILLGLYTKTYIDSPIYGNTTITI